MTRPHRRRPRHATAADVPERPGPLGRLADVAFRRRGRTVLAWLAALRPGRRPVGGLRRRLRGRLLRARLGLQPGAGPARGSGSRRQAGDTVDVVVRADGGVDDRRGPRARSRGLLAGLGGVAARRGGRGPVRRRRARSRRTAGPCVAHARLDVVNPVDMPVADSERADRARRGGRPAGTRGRARRPDHRAGRGRRDRLGGHRPRRRRHHPAADLRLRRRRRPADPRRRRRASPSAAR